VVFSLKTIHRRTKKIEREGGCHVGLGEIGHREKTVAEGEKKAQHPRKRKAADREELRGLLRLLPAGDRKSRG